MGLSSSKIDMNRPVIWEFTGEFVKWEKDDYIRVKLKKNDILEFWKRVFRVHKNEIFNISEHKVSKIGVNIVSGDRVKVTINYKKTDSSDMCGDKLNKSFALSLQELAAQDFASDSGGDIQVKRDVTVNNWVSYDGVKNFNSEVSQSTKKSETKSIKKKNIRKAPKKSAKNCKVGLKMKNDKGEEYEVRKIKNGVKRWFKV